MTRHRRTALVGVVAGLLTALLAPAASPAGTPASAPAGAPAGTSAGVTALPAAVAPTVVPAAAPAGAPEPASQRDTRDAASVLASMSLAQRVGQLFMVGTPATSAHARTLTHITYRHVGNVMLTGRSHAGTRAPARVAAAVQSRATDAATRRVRPFVATDQEGGLVQVLNGAGLSDIPTALEQGRWSPQRLEAEAGRWARQLRAAGVTMNLGPVLDTVPRSFTRQNEPIGALHRHYGTTPERVAGRGVAFAEGMDGNRVAPAVKHFPGLGRVVGNTDTASGVRDTVTGRRSPYLLPFERAIAAGTPFVMMSSAYYTRLDRWHPAVFSRFVIEIVLRGDLGFEGIVISDDLANARQLSRWSYGERAVRFLDAGGTMVLTVNPDALPAMQGAVLERARSSAAFRAKVDRAALLVLRTKQDRGLL